MLSRHATKRQGDQVAEGIQFEGKGLKDLTRDLRLAARSVRREVDIALLEIGVGIAGNAKRIAGEHSQTISATIKMRAVPGMVIVSAGSEGVPIAALVELGNK